VGYYADGELEPANCNVVSRRDSIRAVIKSSLRLLVLTSAQLLSFIHSEPLTPPVRWWKDPLTLSWADIDEIGPDPKHATEWD
jgi:hypothetical protein